MYSSLTVYLFCKPKKEANCGCLPMGLCISPCVVMKLHMKEGVKEYDIL